MSALGGTAAGLGGISGALGTAVQTAGNLTQSLGGALGGATALGGAGGASMQAFTGVMQGVLGVAKLLAIGMGVAAVSALALGAAGAAGGAVAVAGLAGIATAVAAWPLLFQSVRDKISPLFEGLKQNVEGFANSLADRMLPSLKFFAEAANDAFDTLKPTLDRLSPAVSGLIDKIGAELPNVAEALGPLLEKSFFKGSIAIDHMMQGLTTIINGMTDFVAAIDPSRIGPFIDQFSQTVGQVFGDLGTLINNLMPIGQTFMEGFGNIFSSLATQLGDLGTRLEPLLGKMAEFTVQLIDKLGPGVNDLIVAFGDFAIALMDGMQPALKPLGEMFTALADVMNQNKPLFEEMARILGQVMVMGIQALMPLITQFGNWMLENKDLIMEFMNNCLQLAQVALPLLGGAMQVMLFVVTQLAEAFMGFVNTIVETSKAIWEKLVEAFNIAKQKAGEFKEAVVQKFQELKDGAVQKFNEIKQSITDAVSQAKEAASQKFSEMVSTIRSKIDEAVSFVRSMPGRARDALGNLGSILINAGTELIGGFIQGIKNKFGEVKSTLSSLTSMLPSWKGPVQRDKVLLKNAGELVIQGFINGMESQYAQVRNSLQGLTANLSGWVSVGNNGFAFEGNLTAASTSGGMVFAPNIHVDAMVADEHAGRKLEEALQSWWAVNGK